MFSKTNFIKHFSQKARACITCFKELQDLDSNISRLVVPEDSDDDTSNVDSEITSPSDLQADASSSHLHEIVSLESLSPGQSLIFIKYHKCMVVNNIVIFAKKQVHFIVKMLSSYYLFTSYYLFCILMI